ncbi:hypothetical protein HMPREF1981_02452 [Bacteroides pyogenes F0041]|uniref:Uncharacterized protein n=1 Tax=Bacteroides pyogenes F0041 TaxID=1321819 RepID=U2CJB0_9BACE|nr:hypothetical protein HMPREF1981_02452 [Bacteroides pyogenes F0041]
MICAPFPVCVFAKEFSCGANGGKRVVEWRGRAQAFLFQDASVQANGIYAGTFQCKCFFFKMQVFLFLRGGRIGGHRVVAKLSVRGSVFEGLRLRKCFSSENESLFFRAESNAFSKGSRGSAIYEQKLCYG